MAEPRRRFRFLKELAAGGFGKVYLAEMITGDNFSSIVAIKLLHGKWITNDEVVMRSRDEARLLGRLRHRNIVRVEDLTSVQGQCAIVMEYLAGVDLKTACTWLKEQGRPFPRQAAFEVIGEMASALDAAYNQAPLQGGAKLQVIHRDIKPSNAIITVEGDVKVLDFGTARASFEEREAKTQALSFGSAAYMAPERLMGEPDTPAADIFSLGVTLYELLTLESFGKIHIRPEKFEKTVAERIAVVDLAPMPDALQEEAREFLRLLLAYEVTDRPSAEDVVKLAETFSENCRDGGVKKFGRDSVKIIYENLSPEQDPSDPYTGQLIYEDTGTFVSGATGVFPTPEEAPAPAEDDNPFHVPEELADPAAPPPSTTGARQATGARPAQTTGARAVGQTSGARAVGQTTGATSAPRPASQTSAPRPVATSGATSGPHANTSAPRPVAVASGPTSAPPPRHEPTAEEAPKKGGMGKVLVAVGVLGLLGVAGIGVAVVALGGGGAAETSGASSGTVAQADTPKANANLKAGASGMDWAPNGAGKGGVILQVPSGASEVTITSSKGFREEWDGSQNLRIKDLDPGPMRTKLKPKGGGPGLLADFDVEDGKTCQFTFDQAGGGSWKKGECR